MLCWLLGAFYETPFLCHRRQSLLFDSASLHIFLALPIVQVYGDVLGDPGLAG